MCACRRASNHAEKGGLLLIVQRTVTASQPRQASAWKIFSHITYLICMWGPLYWKPFTVIHIIPINGEASTLCNQQQRERNSWEPQSSSASVRTAVPDTPDFSKTHIIHRNLILKEDMRTTNFYDTELCTNLRRLTQGQEECCAEKDGTPGTCPVDKPPCPPSIPPLYFRCSTDFPN